MTSSPDVSDANAFQGEALGLLFGLPMPMARAMALRGEAIGRDRASIRMHYQAAQTNRPLRPARTLHQLRAR
jgi:hypothetical protein